MPPSPLTRIRKICLKLPGAHEVEAWGEPTFRVSNRLFAMYANADNHHGDGHHAVWVNSTQLNQEFMIRANPKRFFSPPYVGAYGWVGVRLDGRVNWKDVATVLADGYELSVSKLKPKQKAALESERSTKSKRAKPRAR